LEELAGKAQEADRRLGVLARPLADHPLPTSLWSTGVILLTSGAGLAAVGVGALVLGTAGTVVTPRWPTGEPRPFPGEHVSAAQERMGLSAASLVVGSVLTTWSVLPATAGLASLAGAYFLAPRAETLDADRDTLTTSLDRCPLQAGPVDNHGCPWPDTDGDGLTDNLDDCILVVGPAENKGCPWPDSDGDGLTDNVDRCVNVAGAQDNGGCPWPDTDRDGVTDNMDHCFRVPGPAANNGCPWPDSDGDGLTDDLDHCPAVRGLPDNNGCPWGDADRDGVLDNEDQCPDQQETINGIDDDDGCPDKGDPDVEVKPDRMVLLLPVLFDQGSAALSVDSFNMFGQVAQHLAANPEILKIRVEVHTDNRGKPEELRALSAERARGIVSFLVTRCGVAEERLEAAGLGSEKPVASNANKRGRDKNNRVEITILERQP
jgi:outer membrane protein OmpA-like peptidoglycan-associated protein